MSLQAFAEKLIRKKTLEDNLMETQLKRCLNLFDVVLFGIGHMIGAGIFVVTGTVTRDVAGPGVILSFMFAGFAAFLSSLCYAEFGAKVPKAGSAYTYTYIAIGEFAAFIIGWNMMLENIIGCASVAKAWSGSLDVLVKGAISNGTIEHIGRLEFAGLFEYLDFVAVACILFWTMFIAAGAKLSSTFINLLTVVNIAVLLLVISLGLHFASISNWKNDHEGGFLPYGFSGVLTGSAACFFAFAGFESIAIISEETKNPSRDIPLALSISVLLVIILYVGTSTSLTLMVPYKQVDVVAPFPAALQTHGSNWATSVIAIGTLIGLSSAIISSLFSLSRSVYAMANDGLLFKWFGYVHPKTQTPLFSVIFFGLICSLLALLLNLELLVELLSIGTLLCFTIVSVNVIILRYQPVSLCQFQLKPDLSTYSISEDDGADKKKLVKESQSHDDIGKLKKRFLNFPLLKSIPPGNMTLISTFFMIIFSTSIWLILLHATHLIINKTWWIIFLLILLSIGFLLAYLLLYTHEQNTSFLTFQVIFVRKSSSTPDL